MDYFLDKMLESWNKIYSLFGLWALALVGLTFLIMIPINCGFTKLFAKGGLTEIKSRTRKLISSIMVFVIAGGVIALFTIAVAKCELNFDLIYQGAIPCGLLAMLLRAAYKFIRDVGLAPFLKAIAESKSFDNMLKDFNLDDLSKTIIKDYINNKLKDIDLSQIDNLIQAENTYISELAIRLTGFTKDPKDIAIKLVKQFMGVNA